jgi:hypothetical protein
MSTALQRAEVALQRAEVIFILRHDVVASEGSSKCTPFSFLSLSDMLLAMVGALEHDLLRCSFVTHFGF